MADEKAARSRRQPSTQERSALVPIRERTVDFYGDYRAECFRVLWQAFAGETASVVVAPTTAPVPITESVAIEHIEHMALAIAQMAREQRAFEQQVDTRFTALQASLQTELVAQHTEVMGRLDQAAAIVGSLMRRVNAVEGMVTSGATIGETQAAEISALVRSIAGELAQRGAGKNPIRASSAPSTASSASPAITTSRPSALAR